MRTTQITIDTHALNHNIERVNDIAQDAHLMIMLKGNAYGHGLDVCTLALLDNKHVKAVGVACMQEALQIRRLGWSKIIVLIEGVFSRDEWKTAINYEIQAVIHHQQQLSWALENIPPQNSPTRTVWLKYNTGMNRLGFAKDEIFDVANQLHNANYQQILTSHFANADVKEHPLNAKQGIAFSKKLAEIQSSISMHIQGSLCNSAGLINFPAWHYDWVRAGIIIYGSSPIVDTPASALNIRAVMHVSCKVIAIHNIQAHEYVGYGSQWTADTDSTIAIISIGYGDGYPRVVDERTFVVINTVDENNNPLSYQCKVIGRVAMDMIVINITHAKNHININDTVDIWGNEPHIDDIASCASTISYELLCRLTTRPQRYIKA